MLKVLRISLVPFIIVTAIILIKYKPQYKVLINNKKIGYVDSINNVNDVVNDIVNSKENANIVFVELESKPVLKLELVSRNIEKKEEEIKQEIAKQVKIEYTNYAITVNGENKVFLGSNEQAQSIIDNVKKEYDDKYTDKLGIIQVYSENNEEINATNEKEAQNIITEIVKKEKKENSIIKDRNINTKVAKVSSANGITFSVKPISGMITSRYGRRSSPGGIGSTNHKGLDIAAKSGTIIKATASGTVTYSGNKGALGNLVIIDHGNGVKTYYGHCNSLYVSEGEKVDAGTVIATVGKTGVATGYHLHFEVHINGNVVNPQKYIY